MPLLFCVEPAQVEDMRSQKIVDVACGAYHTLVLSYEGKVFATGSNSSGQLGLRSLE